MTRTLSFRKGDRTLEIEIDDERAWNAHTLIERAKVVDRAFAQVERGEALKSFARQSVERDNPNRQETRTMQNPTEQLDEMTQDYATKNNVDRPTARVAVMKTADGRRLYAESIGRAQAAAFERTAKADTTTATAKQRELEAFAKSRGLRLADAVKTPEGAALYAEHVAATRGGV